MMTKMQYLNKKVVFNVKESIEFTAIIIDVDELGWTLKITSAKQTSYSINYDVGDIVFYNHSCNIRFKFLDYE